MIPAAFEYEVAESVDHAVELLGQYGEDARPLAGGHSLIPLMRLRLAVPTALIDLGHLDELRYVRDEGDHLAVGALTHHRDILNNELVNEHCGILGYTAGLLGDPSVQHRGTIGGTLAHGDPAGDMPSVICALEGTLVIQGPDGERTVDALNFFKDYLFTDLEPQEIVAEVRSPSSAQTPAGRTRSSAAGPRIGR